MSAKILVVDDEADAVEILKHHLEGAGFATLTASDGRQAVELAREQKPDLIVLDLMLPGLDGFEVCRILRQEEATLSIPVIFLTARGDEIDRIVGLELGAEDYVTKPFSPRELVLRVKRALVRANTLAPRAGTFRCGALAVDFARHEVMVDGIPVVLTAIEFKLLQLLVQRAGYLQSREQLLNDVWNYEVGVPSRTVDTHIRRLREKMGAAAVCLETVRGAGYRFVVNA